MRQLFVRSILSAITTLALAGCSAPPATTAEPTSAPPRASLAAPSPSVLPTDCVCGTEPGCPPCPAPTATATASASPTEVAQGTFPPKAFAPPHDRTKKPGDGEWKPLDVHRGSGSASPLYRAIVHPHKIRGDSVLELVAIDTQRVSMDLVMGTAEPEDSKFPAEKRPGIVPAAKLPDLIAITNGGFKSRHGGHGVGAFGEAALAPTPEFCTFAKAKSGRYVIGTHAKLTSELADGFQWFRQTPPCLIEDGVKHPDLSDEFKAKKWGRSEDKKADIRRSAVGLGADGRTLYFAIGDWLTPEMLADGLAAAGITRAAELDINWSYTRFIVYERSGSDLVATSPLLKELKAPKKEYVKEASERDFFTLMWAPPSK
ncbi:MAG: hypothetical protein HOW73_14025 [Polyangiaceae bacterium]|nr:hypothetical protein [Polyangiaceae bacterium]